MAYDQIASTESVQRAMNALEERGFLPEFVQTKEEAFERVKALIPAGASVMNGSSRTLEQIGLVAHLKGETHGWNNLHHAILVENDPQKQTALRGQATLAEFYLGSAHAISEEGDIVIASNSGSQLPHLAYTSRNIILVVGAQKITQDLNDAINRLETHVFPLEDERMKENGAPGSWISKILILKKEQAFMGRKFHIIFVNEALGF